MFEGIKTFNNKLHYNLQTIPHEKQRNRYVLLKIKILQ